MLSSLKKKSSFYKAGTRHRLNIKFLAYVTKLVSSRNGIQSLSLAANPGFFWPLWVQAWEVILQSQSSVCNSVALLLNKVFSFLSFGLSS